MQKKNYAFIKRKEKFKVLFLSFQKQKWPQDFSRGKSAAMLCSTLSSL
jgi:hypothetical protein